MSSDSPNPLDPSAIFRVVDATMACVNALGILASPIVLMRARKQAEAKGDVYDLGPPLDAFVAIVAGFSPSRRESEDGSRLVALASAVENIRDAMRAKPDRRNDVDRAIIEAARAALEAYGIRAPREGWDAFRGVPG